MPQPPTRPVLRDVDLGQVAQKLSHKAKKKGAAGKLSTTKQKTQTRQKPSSVPVAPDPRLNEKGQAYAQQVAEEKATRAHRKQLLEERNEAKRRERQEQEAEQNQDDDSADESNTSRLPAQSDNDESEDEQLPDAPAMFDKEFVIKRTTARPQAPEARIQTPHEVVSSPLPSRGPRNHATGPSMSQSSPLRRPKHHASRAARHQTFPDRIEAEPEQAEDDYNVTQAKSSHKRKRDGPHVTSDDKIAEDDPTDDDSQTPTDTESTSPEAPSKKQRRHGAGGRPKAHDYEGLTLLVLNAAIAEFQRMQKPGPKSFGRMHARIENMKKDWTIGKKKLIIIRDSTICGRVKDKVVSKVVSYYGFKPGSKLTIIEDNKKLAERLLKEDGYVYEVPQDFKGIYDHPILQDVINEQWFSGKKSEGIVFSASFNPIPDQVIALVFTVVDFVVRQWASGQLVKGTTFNEANFADTYRRHLAGLEAWRNFSDRSAKGLARQKQCLYNHARAHAGMPALQDETKLRFNIANFARAEEAMADESEED